MKETERTEICNVLRELQRERVAIIKTRIMLENRLKACVAVGLGYRAGLDEASRKEAWDAAQAVINQIVDEVWEHPRCEMIAPLVMNSQQGIDGFDLHARLLEKQMIALAKKLPVAGWVESPQRRGFGILSLAILIGECGDLSNYEAPGKIWRRMGCAPFEKNGVMHMGQAWKFQNGKGLTASEWEEFGYCPRRRSIAYVFGENIVKLNSGGPYRQRYDEVKDAKLGLNSEEWPKIRCHRHAMLLATKRLIRDLWCEWNPELVREMVY